MLAGTTLAGLAIAAAHQHVVWSSAPYVGAQPAPHATTIIILGASVLRDGTPSHMLDDRLRTGAELFRRGLAPSVLVSGDGSGDGYDEVSVMRRELIAHGVPEDTIRVDHAGFRTLDTMRRAYETFGVRKAIVVTNPFHVHRSVFLARQAGIEATGYAARGHRYNGRVLVRHHAREYLARVLAWLDVYVLFTEPQVP